MNRRHDAVLDTDGVMKRLDQRRKTVRRTRGIRNDVVVRRYVTIVYAVNKRAIDIRTTRGRNHDFLGSTGDVFACRLGRTKQARAFEYNINAKLAPRQFCGVTFREYLDAVAVDDDIATINFDSAGELAMRGVVARQVRVCLSVAEIIERYDIEFVGAAVLMDGAHDVAPNAAVAVNTNLNCHFFTTPLSIQ